MRKKFCDDASCMILISIIVTELQVHIVTRGREYTCQIFPGSECDYYISMEDDIMLLVRNSKLVSIALLVWSSRPKPRQPWQF